MTDSSSFSSLMALVDSHLSKTSIQSNQPESTSHSLSDHIQIPTCSRGQLNAQSETKLSFSPGQRLAIPTFQFSKSPIQDVLAEQVSNMLKAKELKKQQEEEQRLIEETKRLKIEDDGMIDLMQALQAKPSAAPATKKPETLSSSSSFESLFEPNFIECDEEDEVRVKTPEPQLPCMMDISYILDQKIKKGRCSNFGKVLSSRLRPIAAPYLKEQIHNSIVRFDFTSPSPCDLIKEKLRKPTTYNTYNFNIFEMV